MRISLFTATGHQNLGDELILKQEYELFKRRFPDAAFSIFTYDPQSSLLDASPDIRYIPYFPSDFKKRPFRNLSHLWETVVTIAKSDLVVFGGGGLIYEKEVQKGMAPLKQWKFRILLAKLFFKKIVWMGVGISYPEGKAKDLRYLFSGRRTFVSVRDGYSQRILRSISIPSTLLCDPVFLWDPPAEPKSRHLPNAAKPALTIGISLRRGYFPHEQENIRRIISFLLEKGYKVFLLSHSIHQKDILADDHLFMRSYAKKYNLKITGDIKETLQAYRKIDLLIGMRLHSIILSILHNVPFYGLSYSSKTDELLKELSWNFSSDVRVFDFKAFARSFKKLEDSLSIQKFALKSKCDNMRQINVLEYNLFLDGLGCDKIKSERPQGQDDRMIEDSGE